MADYPFKMNEFCCQGALFLWQLQHFMNMGCLSNTVAMATFTRVLLKITATLIDKICYYASRMNEPSLNDSTKLWFLTLFKCILDNIAECCKVLFGIRLCSIVAKCWKSSKMARIAYTSSFYWIWGLINPHSTHAIPNKYPLHIL